MATRNMEQIAERAEGRIAIDYDINSAEILRLMKLARNADANKTFESICIAFRFGYVMGHRATRRGKVAAQL